MGSLGLTSCRRARRAQIVGGYLHLKCKQSSFATSKKWHAGTNWSVPAQPDVMSMALVAMCSFVYCTFQSIEMWIGGWWLRSTILGIKIRGRCTFNWIIIISVMALIKRNFQETSNIEVKLEELRVSDFVFEGISISRARRSEIPKFQRKWSVWTGLDTFQSQKSSPNVLSLSPVASLRFIHRTLTHNFICRSS